MFACNYILHADYHGVSGFSVSYVPIKIKISHIVNLHSHVEVLSALPKQPCVVISTCLTYVYSYLNKFAP